MLYQSLATALSLCIGYAVAQGSETIFGTVIVSRTGQRTPVLNSSEDATTLTNLGAQQAWSAGNSVRARYNTTLDRWDSTIVSSLQTYALASDNGDFNIQSAQAFLAGLYPPAYITDANAVAADPDNVLWDGSYSASPNGAQYVRIHTADVNDPNSIYLDTTNFCPAWGNWYGEYTGAMKSSGLSDSYQAFYDQVAELVAGSQVSPLLFQYWNAYGVYDFVDFEYGHNATVHAALTDGSLESIDAYNQLRYHSDAFLVGAYANMSSGNSISTIGGSGLATEILHLLEINYASAGELNKMNILFGDYQPLMSFFGLTGLNLAYEELMGLPQYGSYAAIELYAPADTHLYNATSDITGSPLQYPLGNDLYVRFLFANGSDVSPTPYNIFKTDDTPLSWTEFAQSMEDISFSSVAQWCGACDAWETSVFCIAYNSTAQNSINGISQPSIGVAYKGLSAPLAGVIGAMVTLVALGLALLLAVFVGGVGFARRREPLWARRSGSGIGGFKGGAKMASDADLALPKCGAVAGVTNVEKERVGSWELRQKSGGSGVQPAATEGGGIGVAMMHGATAVSPPRNERRSSAVSAVSSVRSSFEHDRHGQNSFRDPVRPREAV